jgi:hypothetical protein
MSGCLRLVVGIWWARWSCRVSLFDGSTPLGWKRAGTEIARTPHALPTRLPSPDRCRTFADWSVSRVAVGHRLADAKRP